MNPKKLGGKASYAAATSSSSPKNWVGHSSEGSHFGNIPNFDQLFHDVAGLSIDTPPDNGWAAVFSKKNKNQGETNSPKQWETGINEELYQTVCDREIVWPPMVVVRYHEKKDDNEKVEKWIVKGNQKIPDYDAIVARHSIGGPLGLFHYFSGYNPVQARHAFGGRGISLLIFENSAIGYVEAQRLHKHFADQGIDKDAWDHCKLLDGTHHKFYGYMANKEDVDFYNQHCPGGMKVKFEMRSHHEMVVIPMDGANPRLFWLYSRAVKGEKDAKACQDGYGYAAEKVREALEENRIVRQKTKMEHEQNKEEVHCELAEILDKEVRETVCDREIVWPPMVLVRYHEKVDKDDNEKWIGMGNQKLPDYNAVEAWHSVGHRGLSLLIFENSAIGYVEAECLHNHFADQGTDRDAWDRCKLLDGTRHQFYGYMANKEDVDFFNQHRPGNMKVKFEMRSHHEMVVIPMDGDNPRHLCLYSRCVKEETNAKARQDYYGKAAEKVRQALEENRIVRQRTKMQHEQNKEKR